MALVIDPTLPVSGDTVTLTVAPTTADILVFTLLAKPSLSTLPLGHLMLDGGDRSLSVFAAAESGMTCNSFIPDVAGNYTFRVYQIRITPGVPRFIGDPVGDAFLSLITSSQEVVRVAEELTLPVMMKDGQGATLVVRGVTDTGGVQRVVEAEMSSPTNEVARLAILNAAVTAALAALIGVEVALINIPFLLSLNGLVAAYDTHRQSFGGGGAHTRIDTVHICYREEAHSNEGGLLLLKDISEVLTQHLVSGYRVPGGNVHTGDDLVNPPRTAWAYNLGAGVVHLAELRNQVFERHRLNVAPIVPGCHANAIPAVALASGLLDDVICAYIDAYHALTPTTPAQEPRAGHLLAHFWGMKKK